MIAMRPWLVLGLLCACNRGPATAPAFADQPEGSATGGATVSAVPKGTPQPKLATGTVELEVAPRAPRKLEVEVAATEKERQLGLMFRQKLGADQGMLFLFPSERHNSFWMHNTLIPLDMFFIDSEWNVVGVVEGARPLTDDPRQVDKLSQYVLEVNAGFAARHRLGVGAKLKFVPPSGLEMP